MTAIGGLKPTVNGIDYMTLHSTWCFQGFFLQQNLSIMTWVHKQLNTSRGQLCNGKAAQTFGDTAPSTAPNQAWGKPSKAGAATARQKGANKQQVCQAGKLAGRIKARGNSAVQNTKITLAKPELTTSHIHPIGWLRCQIIFGFRMVSASLPFVKDMVAIATSTMCTNHTNQPSRFHEPHITYNTLLKNLLGTWNSTHLIQQPPGVPHVCDSRLSCKGCKGACR